MWGGFCATRVICQRLEHKAICMHTYIQGVSFILLSTLQMSQGMPADPGFLCDQAVALGGTIKRTLRNCDTWKNVLPFV